MLLPSWHSFRLVGPVKLLPNFSRTLLRMHRNLKKSTSRARNVPVTRTPVEGEKQLLQAVKFVAKNLPGFHLGLDEDFQMAGSFQELIHGYTTGLVEPCMMPRSPTPRIESYYSGSDHSLSRRAYHLKNGKKQPHCAHLTGLPITVFCYCGI